MLKNAGLVALLCAAGVLGGGPRGSYAAVITWGSPANITEVGNVAKDGTLQLAITFGDSAVTSKNVNGVTFAPFAVTGNSTTVGNVTFSHPNGGFQTSTGLGFAAPPFSNLDGSYQSLLQSGAGGFGDTTLIIGGLQAGLKYQFEWWTNDSSLLHGVYVTNAHAGNTVLLSDNTTGVKGGLGQYAIGTFVADGASQSIIFTGTADFPLINAIAVRVVPLPGGVWAGIGMLLGMGAVRVVRRRG